jgi:hypothetical protein
MNGGLLSQPARLGGMLGIGFLVIFIAAILLQGEGPSTTDSVEEIRAYYTDDGQTYLITDYISGLALVFLFLPFIICLRAVLMRGEPEPRILTTLLFAAGIVTLAVGGAGATSLGTLAMGAQDETLDDSTIKMLMYMSDYGFAGISLGFGLIAVTAGVLMVLTGAVAKWTGYLGMVVAVINVIGAAWVIDGDQEGALAALAVIGLLTFAIWILCVSIMLLRQPQATAAHVEPAAV